MSVKYPENPEVLFLSGLNTLKRLEVFRVIASKPVVSEQEILNELHWLTLGTLYSIVREFRFRSLVEFERPEDRRVHNYTLTEKGRQILEEAKMI